MAQLSEIVTYCPRYSRMNPEKGEPCRPSSSVHPAALLPLTVPEIRYLLTRLALSAWPNAPDVLRWSHWRRRHQIRAQAAHYRSRLKRKSEVQL